MKQRSFFWPFFLIAAGIVWLLIELHTIPIENLWSLLYIWPFFLMAAGVVLILRSRWPVAQLLVSSLTVLGMLLAVVLAPQLGWNQAPAWGTLHLGDFGNFNGTVPGSGMVVSQTRALTEFKSVRINYPVELTIQQGNVPSVTVEAEDNLLPQLSTRISGGTLYIENNQPNWTQRVNPGRPVVVNLTVPELQQVDFPSAGTLNILNFDASQLGVSISGAGSVHLTNLTANTLTISLSGAGTITATGSVDQLNMDISGLGGFQGADLSTQTTEISISGAGNATVWAKTTLNVEISGTGSVNYYGSPNISRQVSGIGHMSGLGNK